MTETEMLPVLLPPLNLKTFKEETQDYIDSINQFLENHDDLDINTEIVLEEVMNKLEQIVGYLF